MFTLEEKHLEAAKKIAEKHRRRKSCDVCYDRGWIGVTEQNMLVLCTHCVDMEAAMAEWKEYINEHEELKEHYSELFDEKVEEEEEEDHPNPSPHEHKKIQPQPKKQPFVPGEKRSGRIKKI
ncbi:MAG: hypothetical protein R6T89_01915 [Candidatus Syntrophosphaera sp.]